MQREDVVGRRKPASGVLISLAEPTIVFVTVCSEKREPWVAQPRVHEFVRAAWSDAQAWLVGYYLLMPDHIHFFCAPHDTAFTLDTWIKYWKRRFSIRANCEQWKWQEHKWDRRLRRQESYTEKWEYIRQNPARKGLVANADDWPYQGMIDVLRW